MNRALCTSFLPAATRFGMRAAMVMSFLRRAEKIVPPPPAANIPTNPVLYSSEPWKFLFFFVWLLAGDPAPVSIFEQEFVQSARHSCSWTHAAPRSTCQSVGKPGRPLVVIVNNNNNNNIELVSLYRSWPTGWSFELNHVLSILNTRATQILTSCLQQASIALIVGRID
mmetsp:Transcript_30350/g.45730  ORF Transcript_30350/g.45730 Transcript_30350/m.45730 type:complete len:169 (+) Transcript_30350:960-1466(+)